MQTSGVGSASVSSRADHMRLSFPETRKNAQPRGLASAYYHPSTFAPCRAGPQLAHGMQTSEHMEASHVVPGLAISGTQPSATPSDDDTGSGIGMAEVRATLLTSSPPHSPGVCSTAPPHRTGPEAVPRHEHGRHAAARRAGAAGRRARARGSTRGGRTGSLDGCCSRRPGAIHVDAACASGDQTALTPAPTLTLAPTLALTLTPALTPALAPTLTLPLTTLTLTRSARGRSLCTCLRSPTCPRSSTCPWSSRTTAWPAASTGVRSPAPWPTDRRHRSSSSSSRWGLHPNR